MNTIHTELSLRIQQLQQVIQRENADACIVATTVNLFYFCNFIFDGYLYVLPEGEPLLFVKRPESLKGDNILFIRKPEHITEMLQERGIEKPRKALFEAETMSYSTSNRLLSALDAPETVNASGIIRQIRSVKSEYELGMLRQCAKIQSEIYAAIPSLYKPGMTDVEFQTEVEYLMRKKGSLGIFRAYGQNMEIFMGSVLSGNNAQAASPFDFSIGGNGMSPVLPIGADGHVLTEGTTVMFDMAGNFTPYQSDMSRTFALGKVDEKAYTAHQLSMEMNDWVVANVKLGMACAEIYNYCLRISQEHGFADNFMGTTQQAKFVGHGLGLEINEPPVLTPRSKEILQSNMAFAFEPKFIFPHIGAVGIENTFIVTPSGVEKITLCEESMLSL